MSNPDEHYDVCIPAMPQQFFICVEGRGVFTVGADDVLRILEEEFIPAECEIVTITTPDRIMSIRGVWPDGSYVESVRAIPMYDYHPFPTASA